MMVEVSINLIIFCPFMEDIIVNKFNSDMIITVNWSDRKTSRREHNQMISVVVPAKVQYLASVLD